MGKSSPPKPEKPKASAQETELADQGAQKWNRYIEQYSPLEKTELANVGRSTKNLAAGQGNAELMQQASQDAMRGLATPNVATGLTTLGKMNSALSSAGGVNSTSALFSDRVNRDNRMSAAIDRGLGQSGRQMRGLSQLGRQENNLALRRYSMENRAANNESRNDVKALSSLAETGVGIYARGKMNQQRSQRLFEIQNPNGFSDQVDTGKARNS